LLFRILLFTISSVTFGEFNDAEYPDSPDRGIVAGASLSFPEETEVDEFVKVDCPFVFLMQPIATHLSVRVLALDHSNAILNPLQNVNS
jgi:hypothetical protein